ncbi:hypothetical protein J0A67_15140 [Algoriphagus aestuariicola]|jgi:hypothetical protein|uniref:Uncharacterized protein n=1 Tax=Algoriphagus aestuariicola TaxID=1852016 RepID=A0ABS3BT04_9BACT|nr:hypothetical protein [Algoriphagus aestuariicola]MBN7802207.1 hypothetical protein [Algoriphagus aestuariicola]
MNELLIYTFLLLAVLAHCVVAVMMYREVNADSDLSFHEKNSWKLKALLSPALFLFYYRQEKKRRIRPR